MPVVEQDAAVGLVRATDDGQCVVDRRNVADRHDLDHDLHPILRAVFADATEGVAHACDVGRAGVVQTRRDLHAVRADRLGGSEDLVPELVGGLAAFAIQIPVDQELELAILQSSVVEDLLDRGQADLVGSGQQIGVDQAHAAVAGLGRRLGTLLERERADLGRAEGIYVAGQREVGSQEFDVLCGHESSLW